MHEHAYLLGKNLIWIRDRLGTTRFEEEVENSLWFGVRTAYNAMAFSKRCDSAGFLQPYHPCATATVAVALPPLPSGKFRLLYADPPWHYDFSRSDSRRIESQYPTLTTEEICDYCAVCGTRETPG